MNEGVATKDILLTVDGIELDVDDKEVGKFGRSDDDNDDIIADE